MNYLIRQEIEGLKGEKELSKETLSAEKYSFERQLKHGLGEEIMRDLSNPPKKSFIVGVKNRYRRWKTIWKGKRMERKIKKGGF